MQGMGEKLALLAVISCNDISLVVNTVSPFPYLQTLTSILGDLVCDVNLEVWNNCHLVLHFQTKMYTHIKIADYSSQLYTATFFTFNDHNLFFL